jgi:hypothetical protein
VKLVACLVALLVSCATASEVAKEAKKIPVSDRIHAEAMLISAACQECGLDPKCPEDAKALCAQFTGCGSDAEADAGVAVDGSSQ